MIQILFSLFALNFEMYACKLSGVVVGGRFCVGIRMCGVSRVVAAYFCNKDVSFVWLVIRRTILLCDNDGQTELLLKIKMMLESDCIVKFMFCFPTKHQAGLNGITRS